MNRREFVVASTAAALVSQLPAANRTMKTQPSSVHLFSKHLQFLDYEAMAAKAAEIGFDGVDLTVRPRGHVEPADAKRDLPRAAAALRDQGLPPLMCTTAFSSANDPHFESTLDAIAEAGFKHLRIGYFRHDPNLHPAQHIDKVRRALPPLVEALRRRGLNGALQNHAGARNIGSSLWEYWQVLEGTDPTALGIQFDIRHATAERGDSWEVELAIAAPKISSLVIKDFKWVEDPQTGLPQLLNTPLDEGWVDFPRYFKLLRERDISTPTSLHFEYDLGGADHGDRDIKIPPAEVYTAMRRDLTILRGYLG